MLITVAATVQGAAGQTQVTARERFELFNNCGRMRLIVEGLNPDAAAIGLTEKRLQFAVESRLRGARLYTSDPGGRPVVRQRHLCPRSLQHNP